MQIILYDCVCAFQLLEHIPYEDAIRVFNELIRVAKCIVIISLPNAKVLWHYSVHIPIIGVLNIHIPRPYLRKKAHVFRGQHYWEINKKDYSIKKIKSDLNAENVRLLNSYRVWQHPYHHYFIYKKEH